MDSNYLLQVDYRQHRNDHSDYRHSYPSSSSSDDPQYWPSYAYPAQSSHYARYIPPQCEPQLDPGPPFISEANSVPPEDFTPSTRLGLFDITAMHQQVSTVEPWCGPRNEGQHLVPFGFSLCLCSHPRHPLS